MALKKLIINLIIIRKAIIKGRAAKLDCSSTAMGYPTVWVGGLKGVVQEKDLTEKFSQCGEILHVIIVRDEETKKSK